MLSYKFIRAEVNENNTTSAQQNIKIESRR